MQKLNSTLLAFGVLALASASPQEEHLLKESDHKKLGKEIAECIEAKNAEKGLLKAEEGLREALLKWKKKKPFKEVDPLSATSDLGMSLWYANEYDRKKVTKGKVGSVQVITPYKYEIEYCVWAPSKYRAKSGPYPLVLSIPDAGQRPFDHLTEDWALGELRGKVILAAVPMPEDVKAWQGLGGVGAPGGLTNLLTVFREMTSNYAVDFDKIFVAGKGAGVSAALELSQYFPGRFAGVIGRAGDAGETSHANFSNLPVYFAGGGQNATAFAAAMDEAGFAEVVTYPEALEEDVLDWILNTTRAANPGEVNFIPPEPFASRAYWLEIPATEEIEGRMIHGKVDRATNEITITAKHVSDVTIYFNDIMVDLDLPVTVICNGVKNEDLIPRNFTTMMRLIYRARSDAGRFYTAARTYDVPKATEEDDEG